FSRSETYTPGGQPEIANTGFLQTDTLDPATLATKASTKHYFFNVPSDQFYPSDGISYNGFKFAKEYQTDALDFNGSILKRQAETWSQTRVAWLDPRLGDDFSPPNNPHIIQTDSTWMSTNQVARQKFYFDANNNRIAAEEFDFGVGS